MMVGIGKVVCVMIFLLLASCDSGVRTTGGQSKEGLVITHTPLKISQVPKELVEELEYPYVRFYRTEVVNTADVPVRIIWFDAYLARNGSWSSGNVRNKILGNSDFLDWHTHDDIKNGWLRPGGKATCFVNWHWTETPEDLPVKWAYIAVDARGNDYFAEAAVPEIQPEKLK